MRTATKQEAINGNSNDTVITPLRLKQVLSNVDINPGEGGGSSDAPVYTAGEGISITNNVITNTITKTSQLTNDSNFITSDDIPETSQKEEVVIQYSKPTNGEDLWIQRSDNLFIPNKTKTGYRITSDGSLDYKADTRYWINDYQEIEPSTVYTFGHKSYASSSYHAWYDENKNFISAFQQVNNKVTTVTSPSNAKYIRLSLFSGNDNYGDDLKTFQFVKGKTLPDYYAPYMKGTKLYTKTSSDYKQILNTEDKFTLPIASANTLGGVKIGNNLTIDANGVLSAIGGGGGSAGGGSSEALIDTFKLPSNQNISTSTFTTIIYETAVGTCFSTSNDGNITCTKDGTYLILLNTIFNTNTSGGRYQDIRYNGSSYALSTLVGVSGLRSCLTSFAILKLKAGDVLFARAYQTSGSALPLISGTSGSSINFIKLEGSGSGITEETDPVFTGSPAYNITAEDITNWNNYTNLGITTEDIDNWNNKQEQLVSGVNIKTIDGQSILGSGNISTEYTAGEGINIKDRVITNTITSYNDLKDLPFIPTKITDLIGGEDFPTDPENPDETGPWARVDRNNYFRTDQTVIGDINADKVKASTQLSISALGFYLESDGSYTLGKVAE